MTVEKERRYIVVKFNDMDSEEEVALCDFLDSWQIPTRECLVVEPHHPHYDETWENIRRVVEGEPTIGEERDAMAAYVEEFRSVLKYSCVVMERTSNDTLDGKEAARLGRALLKQRSDVSLARLINSLADKAESSDIDVEVTYDDHCGSPLHHDVDISSHVAAWLRGLAGETSSSSRGR